VVLSIFGEKGGLMKRKLGAKNCLYPMPTTLVGAMVKGKPTFITIAHVGIMDLGSVSLGMNKMHYTNAGIQESGTFSVNIPTVEMVKEADYCGLVSGKNVDKAALFEVFYGNLKTAPMIEECPINMECRLVQTVDFPRHDIFIGEIVEAYCEERCLTEGIVDFSKVQPILFAMNDKSYWKLGERLARAWHVGKGFKKS
jgi:flavin reductase (DIM6/NTAB) family NADH-FMN oxidoreductase RutF